MDGWMDGQTDRVISDSRQTKTNVQLLVCTFRCSFAVMVLNACRNVLPCASIFAHVIFSRATWTITVRHYSTLFVWNCLDVDWCVICLPLSPLVLFNSFNPSQGEVLFGRCQDLCDARLQPDRVSFSSASAACQRTAAVDQAWQLLKQLPRHSLSHWAPQVWKRVANSPWYKWGSWWKCMKMFGFYAIE